MTKAVFPTRAPSWLPLVFVLLLPVLVSGVGVWEVLRGAATRAEYRDIAAGLSARIEAVQALRQQDRPPASVGIAIARLQRAHDAAATDLLVARWREPAAWLAALAGLAATAAGAAGLVMASNASRRGMASRAALVAAFGRVCRVLPTALGVLVGGLALAVLGITAFEISGMQFLAETGGRATQGAMLGLAYAAVALWGSFRALRNLRLALRVLEPRPDPLLAVPVAEADAPGLFALLRGLVGERQSVMPDAVAVGVAHGFFVTAFPHTLYGASVNDGARDTRGRMLHFPLAALATLDLVELRTVLAHELAHFSGKDLEYSARFQPLYVALGRSAEAMAVLQNAAWGKDAADRFLKGVVHPHTALANHVFEHFDLVVLHWSRVRELEADRAAVASGSAEALGSSLLRVGLVDGLLAAELDRIAKHPDAAPPDLAASVVARTRADGIGDPAQHGGDQAPHPTDTHPPSRQRIAAAGLAMDDALMARAARPVDEVEFASVRALFADWDALVRRVTGDVRLLYVERHRQHREQLRDIAGATGATGAGTTELYASVRLPALGLLLLGSFCLLVAVSCTWSALYGIQQDQDAWPLLGAVAACGVLGLGSTVLWTIRLLRDRDVPYLVLTPEGFHSPGFVGVVPWLALRAWQVSAFGSPATGFYFRPDAELPRRTGVIRRLHVNRPLQAVHFEALRPRGMKAAAFQDLLSRYANAAHARAALDGGAEEGAPAPGVQ